MSTGASPSSRHDPVSHRSLGVSLLGVPTSRPRHVITETDEVARALAVAARRWPDDKDRPGQLLKHLSEAGARASRAERDAALATRRNAIERVAGQLTGAYGEGYLPGLREDWPE